MKRFSHYLTETALLSEGSFAKFKVGEQPKFSDRDKEKIGKRLSDYVKMNPNDIQDIHYSAVGKQVKSFLNTNQTEIKVTDKKVLKRLAKYMSIFTVDVNGDNVKVTQGKGKVLIKFNNRRYCVCMIDERFIPILVKNKTNNIVYLVSCRMLATIVLIEL